MSILDKYKFRVTKVEYKINHICYYPQYTSKLIRWTKDGDWCGIHTNSYIRVDGSTKFIYNVSSREFETVCGSEQEAVDCISEFKKHLLIEEQNIPKISYIELKTSNGLKDKRFRIRRHDFKHKVSEFYPQIRMEDTWYGINNFDITWAINETYCDVKSEQEALDVIEKYRKKILEYEQNEPKVTHKEI